jgi:hypothetical protein
LRVRRGQTVSTASAAPIGEKPSRRDQFPGIAVNFSEAGGSVHAMKER